jgi:RluA family pseudouridine synthase
MRKGVAWEIIVPRDEIPKKLENFLKKRFPIGYVRKLFRRHAVRLNGRRCLPTDLAGPGDRLELFIPFERKTDAARETGRPAAELDILFEDESLIVVDKPAGIAVHEGKEVTRRESLLGALEAAYRPQGIAPRLVHRLDRETSGVLVVAKSQQSAEELERRFEEGDVDKEYLALVVGALRPREGRIDIPLPGRDAKPAQALTIYRVEKEFADTSLVRVRTETGRMHQIRLHFARLGHPLVLDSRHGDFALNRRFSKAHGLKRLFLHAATIGLHHKGKKQQWSAPLPHDLARALESLEGGRS